MSEGLPWIENYSTNPIDKKMVFRNTNIFDMEDDNCSFVEEKDTKIDIDSEKVAKSTSFIVDTQALDSKNILESRANSQLDILNPKGFEDISNVESTQDFTNSIIVENDQIDFVSLALKYRPKSFKELVGQESIAQTLSLALDNKKISNAYLFSGLRGSGKTSSARIFAKCLQCQRGISSTPCEICDSCIASKKQNHMDIIELDAASNRGIDDVRNIIDHTKYNPSYGRFKIFIIDEVHMLTNQAFNALLKTLEEPPSHIKFILATTDPLKVPVTILSRVQHFRFKKIQNIILKKHMKYILDTECVRYEEEMLDILIRSGNGSVRDTITTMEQAIIYCNGNITLEGISNMLGTINPSSFDYLFDLILKNDRGACIDFIAQIGEHSAEMIIDELSIYVKNKLLENNPNIPLEMGMRYANILSESKYMLKNDFNEDFLLLLTILKMLEAQKVLDIDYAIQSMENKIKSTQGSSAMQNLAHSTVQNALNNTEGAPISKPQEHNIFPNQMQNKAQNLQSNEDTNLLENISTNQDATQKQSQMETEVKNTKEFNLLISKLYHRDYKVGEIFEQKVRYKDFQNGILYLDFYTSEAENQALRIAYPAMLEIIKDIFDNNVRLKVDKKSPETLNDIGKSPNEIGQFKEQNKEAFQMLNKELGINKISIIEND